MGIKKTTLINNYLNKKLYKIAIYEYKKIIL